VRLLKTYVAYRLAPVSIVGVLFAAATLVILGLFLVALLYRIVSGLLDWRVTL